MSIETIRQLRREGRHEEARALAVALASRHADDAELQFEAASLCDFLGQEARAVPFYLAALAGSLTGNHRRQALLGLGSTYRTLGRYGEAEATLRSGLSEFPDGSEFNVFLAMTWHNLGRSKEAVELLLTVIATTSTNPDIQPYRRAIGFYAQDVERIRP